MGPLILVLALKIVVAVVFIVVPFLLWPQAKLERLTVTTARSPWLYRVYGVAILALVVAYSTGVWRAYQGLFPWGVVLMGVVSNGGAAVVLLFHESTDRKWSSIITFGSIAVCLLVCAMFPEYALKPLF